MSVSEAESSRESVRTLEMTYVPEVEAGMCEDCACPRSSATVKGTAGNLALVRATSEDGQMPVSFALTVSPERSE